MTIATSINAAGQVGFAAYVNGVYAGWGGTREAAIYAAHCYLSR